MCICVYAQVLAGYTQLLLYGEGTLMDLLRMFLFSNRQRATTAQSDTMYSTYVPTNMAMQPL